MEGNEFIFIVLFIIDFFKLFQFITNKIKKIIN